MSKMIVVNAAFMLALLADSPAMATLGHFYGSTVATTGFAGDPNPHIAWRAAGQHFWQTPITVADVGTTWTFTEENSVTMGIDWADLNQVLNDAHQVLVAGGVAVVLGASGTAVPHQSAVARSNPYLPGGPLPDGIQVQRIDLTLSHLSVTPREDMGVIVTSRTRISVWAIVPEPSSLGGFLCGAMLLLVPHRHHPPNCRR